MKTRIKTATVLLFAALLPTLLTAQTTVVTADRYLDVDTGELISPTVIVGSEAVIESINPASPPEDAERIDLELDFTTGIADGEEVVCAVRYQIKHGAKVIKICARTRCPWNRTYTSVYHIAIHRIWSSHMKTTLNISDATWKAVKREAARRGQTMSSLVEAALQSFLRRPDRQAGLPPLPSFEMGEALVDLSDRKTLHDILD